MSGRPATAGTHVPTEGNGGAAFIAWIQRPISRCGRSASAQRFWVDGVIVGWGAGAQGASRSRL